MLLADVDLLEILVPLGPDRPLVLVERKGRVVVEVEVDLVGLEHAEFQEGRAFLLARVGRRRQVKLPQEHTCGGHRRVVVAWPGIAVDAVVIAA